MPDEAIAIPEMRGITKRFPGMLALDGVDLTVLGGEIQALVGQNGAGKSTFVKILAGDYTADDSSIDIDGHLVEIHNTRQARELGIGIVYQELSLLPNLTVAGNISLGHEPGRGIVIDKVESEGDVEGWMEADIAFRRALIGATHNPFFIALLEPVIDRLREAVEKVAAVRAAAGPDVRIGLDAHGRFGLMSALQLLRELEQYDLFFIEEPLHPGDMEGLAQLVRQSRIPIVLGERLYSRWDYRRLLQAELAPMIQPDVIHVGGISELRKIAAMAEVCGVGIAPHNAAGPISTAATLQAAACMPNIQIQEMFDPQDAPWRDDLARPPIAVINGRVQIPQGPGLGIEMDEEVALAHPGKPRSLAFYSEGSILEIEYQPQ